MILILVSVLLEIIFALLHLVVIQDIICESFTFSATEYFGVTKDKTKTHTIKSVVKEGILEMTYIKALICFTFALVVIFVDGYDLMSKNPSNYNISDLIILHTTLHIMVEIAWSLTILIVGFIDGSFVKMYNAIKDKLNEQELIDNKLKIKIN